jgi:hypothetical protein
MSVTLVYTVIITVAMVMLLSGFRQGFDSRQGQDMSLVTSRPPLGPTHPPIQWVLWALSQR